MTKINYLDKKRIIPKQIDSTINIKELVEYYSDSSSYNGGRLADACKIYEKMLDKNATICLTIAGAMIPAGLGGLIISLIKRGFVDFIISTGANLYHDLHFALGLPVHQGDFCIDDKELLDHDIVRIYDIFIPMSTLIETDKFIQEVFTKKQFNTPISTAELHYNLGKALLKHKNYELSISAIAAKYDVPIYTPAPADSSIGMNLAYLKDRGIEIRIDPNLDILETTAIVYNSKLNGVIEIGGGSPKNFYMQTQPMLSQIMEIKRGGHDFFIQITTDPPHYGGLSGATPHEAVSWGKINPNEIKNGVVVYCDATIAAPILFSYIIAKKDKRPLKRLYTKRIELIDKLKDASK